MTPENPDNSAMRDAGAIHSEFADDPDMIDLVEMFVGEMDQRISDLEQAFDQQQLESIRQIAHQLKGAGGGYGFHIVTDKAAALERQIKSQAPLQEIQDAMYSLVDVCQRLEAGTRKLAT